MYKIDATIGYKQNKSIVFTDDTFIKNKMKDLNIEYEHLEYESIIDEADTCIVAIDKLLIFRHCGKKNDTGWIMYKYNNLKDMESDWKKFQ
jgi:hypothetical protein